LPFSIRIGSRTKLAGSLFSRIAIVCAIAGAASFAARHCQPSAVAVPMPAIVPFWLT
jgi:hypothetical protein